MCCTADFGQKVYKRPKQGFNFVSMDLDSRRRGPRLAAPGNLDSRRQEVMINTKSQYYIKRSSN